jgi:predicted metal-dependent hydrolase
VSITVRFNSQGQRRLCLKPVVHVPFRDQPVRENPVEEMWRQQQAWIEDHAREISEMRRYGEGLPGRTSELIRYFEDQILWRWKNP